ncbi:MAG: hypothetical protein GY729_11990 [Desulfobacteraceae bacterium]|nr:hypothetical protein [Desulfobacteraceae bacterium]
MNDNDWNKAIGSFSRAENAIQKIPGKNLAAKDLLRIHTQKGIAYHEKGLNLWKDKGTSTKALHFYKKAKSSLISALQIDPLDYLPAYWMARTENAMEILSASLFPDNPRQYNTQSLYEKAMSLRPNGVSVHYDYLRYLNYKGKTKKLSEIAQLLIQIYPESYYQLIKEPFFNDIFITQLEKGFLLLLEKEGLSRIALRALSDIYKTKRQFDQAAFYFRKSLEKEDQNNPYDYIHMGMLCLKIQDRVQSIPWFTKGMETAENLDAVIKRIYEIHRQEDALDEFIKLLTNAQKKRALSLGLDIHIARALLATNKLELARTRLLALNKKRPNAKTYYLLAKISEKERDFRQAELLAQRATTLDKNNYAYFYLFSRTLHQQKKYRQAEKMIHKAIQYSPKANPWLFSHRAWTRWEQGKHMKAASDWANAFRIKPDNSDFLFWAARAYEQKKMFGLSLTFLQKAIAMHPDNPQYNALKDRLESQKQ